MILCYSLLDTTSFDAKLVALRARLEEVLGEQLILLMRILAIADLHGNRGLRRWFVRQARERQVDALVLAGDILGFPDEVDDPEDDQAIDARHVEADLLAADLPVLFVLGNDDLIEFDPADERFVSLHGRRVDLSEFNFVGYRYSLPWMGSAGEKTEEEILADLEGLARLVDSRTVLVTHSPAHGILDPGFGPKEIGSRSLREFLGDHPVRVHIHGHSHAGFGRSGRRRDTCQPSIAVPSIAVGQTRCRRSCQRPQRASSDSALAETGRRPQSLRRRSCAPA